MDVMSVYQAGMQRANRDWPGARGQLVCLLGLSLLVCPIGNQLQGGVERPRDHCAYSRCMLLSPVRRTGLL